VNTLKRHGFAYVMSAFFAASLILHFLFSYLSHQSNEERLDYTFLRDMFENWQSEMLQLLLQVVLLAYLWYVGSSQSHEGDTRLEAKIDFIMRELNPIQAEKLKKDLEKLYPKK
jgi:hypothetical protein